MREFREVYNSVFDGDADEFVKHLFRSFDMDKDGYVDFKGKLSQALYHSPYWQVPKCVVFIEKTGVLDADNAQKNKTKKQNIIKKKRK